MTGKERKEYMEFMFSSENIRRKASLRPAELLGQASLQSKAVIISRHGGHDGRKEKNK